MGKNWEIGEKFGKNRKNSKKNKEEWKEIEGKRWKMAKEAK